MGAQGSVRSHYPQHFHCPQENFLERHDCDHDRRDCDHDRRDCDRDRRDCDHDRRDCDRDRDRDRDYTQNRWDAGAVDRQSDRNCENWVCRTK